jgi:hypothetical protein
MDGVESKNPALDNHHMLFYLSQSSLLQIKQKREQNSHQRSDDAKINPVVLSSHT